MNKQDKIDIINEALEVLYDEVNNFSIRLDYPLERLTNVSQSIFNLEKLLVLFDEINKINEINEITREGVR